MFPTKPDPLSLKSTGNAALALTLARRTNPIFLKRNWVAALDYHERTIATTMGGGTKRPAGEDADDDGRSKRARSLKQWSGADRKALRTFIHVQHETRGRPPKIEITHLALQTHKSHSQTQTITPVATPNDGGDLTDTPEPEWLEDDSKSGIPCSGLISGTNGYVRTEPFHGHLNLVDKKWVLTPSRPVLVDINIHYSQSADRSVEVQEAPDSFKVLDEDDPIELRVRLFTSSDVLSALDVQPHSATTDGLDARETQMLQEYGKQAVFLDTEASLIAVLPQLEPVVVDLNHKDLVMDLSMQWHIDAASTLEAFNARTQVKKSPKKILSPKSSETIIFVFQNRTQWTQKGNKCPLCNSKYDYKQFKRLHLHLLTHHDHFSVSVEHEHELGTIIRLDLAERKPGKANINDDDKLKINWIAPQKPFDIDAHLAGDETWSEEPDETMPARTSKKRKKNRPAKPQVAVPQPIYSRLPPEQIPELVPRTRTAHPVPEVTDAAGVKIAFFRTNSKRQLQTGEMVYDSDDDVDTSWIEERRRQNLAALTKTNRKLTAGEATFMCDWDTHRDLEELHGMSGDAFARDGLIRFVRKCGHLENEEYRAAVEKTVMRNQKWNIIDSIDVDYCLKVIRLRSPQQQQQKEDEVNDVPPSSKKSNAADMQTPSTPSRARSRESQQSPQSTGRRKRTAEAQRGRTDTAIMY